MHVRRRRAQPRSTLTAAQSGSQMWTTGWSCRATTACRACRCALCSHLKFMSSLVNLRFPVLRAALPVQSVPDSSSPPPPPPPPGGGIQAEQACQGTVLCVELPSAGPLLSGGVWSGAAQVRRTGLRGQECGRL